MKQHHNFMQVATLQNFVFLSFFLSEFRGLWWRVFGGSVYVWQMSLDIQLQIQSVTWHFQKQKMNINWHLHFLLKCHLNVTCLGIHVISISKCQLACGFFFHKSHYMSHSKLCMSIDVHFIFVQVSACQMSKACKNFVKHTHCLVGFSISTDCGSVGKRST